MNENGNKYALAALKDRRARIAGEVYKLQQRIQGLLKNLAHLDATLVMFDPDMHPSAIRPKRVMSYQRIPLFSHGECGRVILDVMREANGKPLASHEIAALVVAKLNIPASSRPAINSRVRSNLTYLKAKGAVSKSGDKKAARWMLTSD